MSLNRGLAVGALLLGAACVAGCASLDALAVAETHRLGDAPYYVDVGSPRPGPGSCAVVLPVQLDSALRDALGYGDRLARFQPLLAAVDRRIADLGGCVRAASVAPPAEGSPKLYVGIEGSDLAPMDAVGQRLDSDRFPPMVLHLKRPGAAWQQAVARVADGAPYVILVQLGVSQYGKGYSGVFRKEVALGTGYRQPIRFLTAEDKPVEVLHLTGVLVDAGTGRVVRAGAEGIVLRDTPFLAQTLDVARVIDDITLERVLEDERRTDLAGNPLKLDVALDNLIAQLTRGEVRVPAR